jgi:hypothetical protein
MEQLLRPKAANNFVEHWSPYAQLFLKTSVLQKEVSTKPRLNLYLKLWSSLVDHFSAFACSPFSVVDAYLPFKFTVRLRCQVSWFDNFYWTGLP